MSSQGTAKLIDFGLAADDSLLNRNDGPDLQTALDEQFARDEVP